MTIADFLLIHHIMRILQAYLTLGKVFGCFGLKLDKLDNYRTFHSAWCCELVYTIESYKLCCEIRCKLVYIVRSHKLRWEIHCKLADTVNATGFAGANSYFDGFKRINGHQMSSGTWHNHLEVI
jgi:hypothetical protein